MSRPSTVLDTGREHGSVASRILDRIRRLDPVWGSYALELTFDALLEYYLATGNVAYRDYVLAVLYRRNERLDEAIPYEHRPFGHMIYTIYRCLGDARLVDSFVAESRRLREEVDRSPDGLVLHRSSHRRPFVLADFMQDYVARMARTGALTGDESFLAEAITQIRLHRDLLCDPQAGLWRQGRGWDAAECDSVSPGCWSRGQGWVLRGLLDAWEAFPPEHPAALEIRDCVVVLLDGMLRRQDEQGFWHCLVDRPAQDSMPETSGTAMTSAALYRALMAGHVSGDAYRAAADRAFAAAAGMVDAKGRVSGACIGPGPLTAKLEERYLRRPVADDEAHGWFSVLYACAARAAFEVDRGPARVIPLGGSRP